MKRSALGQGKLEPARAYRSYNTTQTTSRRRRYEMCSWCNHVHRTNGTAMFSTLVRGTDGRVTIGNAMCRNLDCSLRIRNLCGDPPGYMGETIDLDSKVQRLQAAVYEFLYRADVLSDPGVT